MDRLCAFAVRDATDELDHDGGGKEPGFCTMEILAMPDLAHQLGKEIPKGGRRKKRVTLASDQPPGDVLRFFFREGEAGTQT